MKLRHQRQAVVLTTCMAAAVAVNAVGLGLIGWPETVGGATRALGASPVTEVRLLATPMTRSSEPTLAASPARPVAAIDTTLAEANSTAPATLGTGSPQRADRRVYDSTEVDVPAAPQPEWNIDFDAAGRLGGPSLSFEVVVSDEGVVLDAHVLVPPGGNAQAAHEVEQALRRTVMRPAQRAGHAVTSLRRIEVRLVADGAARDL